MPCDCPKCDRALTRIRRKPWMHRIPGSKHYECRECGNAYLLIFHRWLIRRMLTHRKTASRLAKN